MGKSICIENDLVVVNFKEWKQFELPRVSHATRLAAHTLDGTTLQCWMAMNRGFSLQGCL